MMKSALSMPESGWMPSATHPLVFALMPIKTSFASDRQLISQLP
jgi:hypothetical protein